MHTSIRRFLLAGVIAAGAAVHGTGPGGPSLAAQSRPPAGDSAAGGGGGSRTAGAWSVQGPSGGRWVLLWGPEMDVVVAAGDRPLSRVRLAGSTLQNAETGAMLGVSGLRVCGTGAGCPAVGGVGAGQSSSLKLRMGPGGLPAGVYTGTVLLAADGGADVKPLTLRVERTSWWHWVFGGLAILAGVVLAWLVNRYLRQLSLRKAALVPAAQVNEIVTELFGRVGDAVGLTGVGLPQLQARLEECRTALGEGALDEKGLIPSAVPAFFGGADVSGAYSRYLEEQSRHVSTVAVVVRKGVAAAVEAWPGATDRKPVEEALVKLDALAPKVSTPADADEEVSRILDDMHHALAPDLADALGKARKSPAGLPPVRDLLVQIQRVSLAAWGIWLALTLLVGLVALVFTNYGFGTPLDYCKCLLWGLGVPIAGQQLQQLAPNTVTTAFNLTVPK